MKSDNIDFAIVDESRRIVIRKGRKEKMIDSFKRYWSDRKSIKVVPLEGKYLKYYGAD